MSKAYTEQNLSDILDEDLIWRRRELSDLKDAIKLADVHAKAVLLRAVIVMCYAHWEGYVRTCANRYFEHLSLRRKPYSQYERQIYVNCFLVRLDALNRGRVNLEERCKLVNDILDGREKRFASINPELIDTRSNLSTDVIKDICKICGVDSSYFEEQRQFLDLLLLRRRNAIAHGQQEFMQTDQLDDLIASTLNLMGAFRNLLENKVYSKAYAVVA